MDVDGLAANLIAALIVAVWSYSNGALPNWIANALFTAAVDAFVDIVWRPQAPRKARRSARAKEKSDENIGLEDIVRTIVAMVALVCISAEFKEFASSLSQSDTFIIREPPPDWRPHRGLSSDPYLEPYWPSPPRRRPPR
jgi:hypothetical protein